MVQLHPLVQFFDRRLLLAQLTESDAHAQKIESLSGRRTCAPAIQPLSIVPDPIHAELAAFEELLPVTFFSVDIGHIAMNTAGMIESKLWRIIGLPGLYGEVGSCLVNIQGIVQSLPPVKQFCLLHGESYQQNLAI